MSANLAAMLPPRRDRVAVLAAGGSIPEKKIKLACVCRRPCSSLDAALKSLRSCSSFWRLASTDGAEVAFFIWRPRPFRSSKSICISRIKTLRSRLYRVARHLARALCYSSPPADLPRIG